MIPPNGPAEESTDLPMAPTGESTVSSPQSTNTGGVPSGLTSAAVNNAVGYGVNHSPVGDIPGLGGAVAPGISAAIKGGTAEDIGFAALTGGLTSLAKDALAGLGVPGAVTSTGIQVGKEAFKDDPNYGKALTSSAIPGLVGTVTSMVNPALGFVAGTLTSYATEKSLLDGFLGDATNARSFEDQRDVAEDQGYSRSDTEGMAARENLSDSGYTGIGTSFGEANKGTPSGNLKDASVNALGDPDSLASFADREGYGDFGNDGPGAMGDTGGRSSGDPDGDAGSDPN